MPASLRHAAALSLVLAPAVFVSASETQAPWTAPRDWTYAQGDAQWRPIERLLGKPAPELSVSAWRGEALTLAARRGSIVLLDFWATWCAPCVRAVPELNSIHRQFADRGVVVVGVCSSGRGEDKMEQVADQVKMEYPTARDAATSSARRFGVQWFPYVVLIDRDGIVRAAGLSVDRTRQAVERLLAEQPAPPPPNP